MGRLLSLLLGEMLNCHVFYGLGHHLFIMKVMKTPLKCDEKPIEISIFSQ